MGQIKGLCEHKETGQRSHLMGTGGICLEQSEWWRAGYFEEGSKESRQIVQRPEERARQGNFMNKFSLKSIFTLVKIT